MFGDGYVNHVVTAAFPKLVLSAVPGKDRPVLQTVSSPTRSSCFFICYLTMLGR
jgi:hypothetical protein